MKKLLILFAVLPCLAFGQFIGTGINTHAQLLPIDKLKAIGIQWVRADAEVNRLTEAKAAQVRKYYDPMPIMWMLDNRTWDWVGDAKKLYRAGIRHLEALNEPDGAWFLYLTPEQAADRFLEIRFAVPRSMKMYGPSCTTWNPDYVERFLRRIGPKYRELVDGISGHLYMRRVEDMAAVYLECQIRWGLPFICTETGLTPHNRATPEKRIAPDFFLEIRKQLGYLPVCYYDGPNGNADKTMGLFEWNGRDWSTVTDTYRRILAGVQE